MSHRIAHCLFEPLLRFFLPATGRRRRVRTGALGAHAVEVAA